MKSNKLFSELVGLESLRDVSQAEVPNSFRGAVQEGWTVDDTGAYLLKAFRRTYFGDRSSFVDVTSYEAAVNGRGIFDMDISEKGAARARVLARRAFAFSWMALMSVREQYEDPQVTAYITIGQTLSGDGLYTANATFCSRHEGESPYLTDFDQVSNAVLALESAECMAPLPA